MTTLTHDPLVRAVIADSRRPLDVALPGWARRSHPIVRRHLGIFWKVMPPDLNGVLRAVAYQAAYIALSLPVPFLVTLIMPVVMVSLVMLPVALYFYGMALLQIGGLAASHIADERRNESLDLLRVSPISLAQIVYSKMAAAVWRQVDALTFVLMGATYFGLPLIMLQHELVFADAGQPLLARLAMMAGLIASLVRLPLEAVFVAALGALMGAGTRQRGAAMLTTGLLIGAYFALLNLARLLPAGPAGMVFFETVLPLVLPVLGIGVCVRQTLRTLQAE